MCRALGLILEAEGIHRGSEVRRDRNRLTLNDRLSGGQAERGTFLLRDPAAFNFLEWSQSVRHTLLEV